MSWALVIHENRDMADLLRKAVRDTLELPDENVLWVNNFQDVRKQAIEQYGLRPCQVIVLGFSVPASANAPKPLEGNREGALAFYRDMAASRPDLPFVFIDAQSGAGSVLAAEDPPNIRRLSVDESLTALSGALRQLVLKQQPGAGPRCRPLDVDIILTGKFCQWSIPGGGVENTRVLPVSESDLKRLRTMSRRIARIAANCDEPEDDDAEMLAEVGTDIYTLLLEKNSESGLEPAITAYRGRTRFLDETRFRFHLDKDTNAVLVEALAKPDVAGRYNDVQYWMLRAPIMRKFGASSESVPLFKDDMTRERPIDCLFISGQTKGFTALSPISQDFNALKWASDEVDALGAYLEDNRERFGVGEVRILRPQEDHEAGDYWRQVQTVLNEKHWHLIHYAGHSAISKTDRKAYLLLGGKPDDMVEIDRFAKVAMKHRQAQFVFLNSCSSGSETFVSRLVENGIPAVAGYAWPVRDEHAHVFAHKFYKELFESESPKRFLEYAFMRSKAHLYERYPNQLAWAAPLLFMQTSENARHR